MKRLRALQGKPLTVLATLSAVLAIGVAFLNPIYCDEIFVRSLVGTTFRNDFRRLTLYPRCESGFLASVPLVWYPAAFFWEKIYNLLSNPGSLRLFAAVVGLANSWVAGWLVSEQFPRRDYRSTVLTSLFFLGIFPFYLVLARSEGIILLGVLLTSVLCRFPSSRILITQLLRLGLIIGLFLLLVFLHPSVLFFVPIFVVAIARSSSSRLLRISFLLLLLSFTYVSMRFHSGLISCPESPRITAFWGAHAGGAAGGTGGIFGWIGGKLENIAANLNGFVRFLIVAPRNDFGLIPAAAKDDPIFLGAILSAFGMALVGALSSVILLRSRYVGRCIIQGPRTESFPPFLWLALFISVAGGLARMPIPMAYRTTLWVPLIFVLSLSADSLSPRSTSFFRPSSAKFAKLLLCLSASLFVALFLPKVVRDVSKVKPSYPALSTGFLSWPNAKDDVVRLKNECLPRVSREGITTAVDLVTYWSLVDAKTHYFWFYLTEEHGTTPEALSEMFSFGVDRVIIHCSGVPDQLKQMTWVRSGDICCLTLDGERRKA